MSEGGREVCRERRGERERERWEVGGVDEVGGRKGNKHWKRGRELD